MDVRVAAQHLHGEGLLQSRQSARSAREGEFDLLVSIAVIPYQPLSSQLPAVRSAPCALRSPRQLQTAVATADVHPVRPCTARPGA